MSHRVIALFAAAVILVTMSRTAHSVQPNLSNVSFANQTPHVIVVRCVAMQSAAHVIEVPPNTTTSPDGNFSPGMRVVGVWLKDGSKAGSHVFNARAGGSTTVQIKLVNGELNVFTGYGN